MLQKMYYNYFGGYHLMNCQNIFCIYWKDNTCVLSDIELDIQGSCTSCIYVDFNKDELSAIRNKALKKVEGNETKNAF